MAMNGSDLNPESLAARPSFLQSALWWVQDTGRQVCQRKTLVLAVLSGVVLVLSVAAYVWLVALQYPPEDKWSRDLYYTADQPLGRLVVTYPTSLSPGAEDIVTVQLIMTNTTSSGVPLEVGLRSDIPFSTGVVENFERQYDLSRTVQSPGQTKVRAGRPDFFSTGTIVLLIETRLSTAPPDLSAIPISVRSGWAQILLIPIALGILGLLASSLGYRLLITVTKRLKLQGNLESFEP